MFSELKNDIYKFIDKNSFKLFLLLLCVGTGIICGALFSVGVPDEKAIELEDYIVNFGIAADNGSITYISVLKKLLLKSIRSYIILVICSLSTFFIPFILVKIFGMGFATGFTLGFMSLNKGFGGFIIASISVLPEFIINLPLILFLAVACMNNALKKACSHNIHENSTVVDGFIKKTLLIFALIIIGNIINALVITEFSKSAGGLIIR